MARNSFSTPQYDFLRYIHWHNHEHNHEWLKRYNATSTENKIIQLLSNAYFFKRYLRKYNRSEVQTSHMVQCYEGIMPIGTVIVREYVFYVFSKSKKRDFLRFVEVSCQKNVKT